MLSDYTYVELDKACAGLVAVVVARVRDGTDGLEVVCTEVSDTVPNECWFSKRNSEGANVQFHNILPFLDLSGIENIL